MLNNIEKRILNELLYLGYDISLIGTTYLIESIYIVLKNNSIDDINLKEKIYPIIAKKHNKKINNIKCSINYATTRMYDRSEIEKNKRYLHIFNNEKPSSKMIIYSVLNKILW